MNESSVHQPRIVIVSGGSRGLGAGIVNDLLRQGLVVCTFSRTPPDFAGDAKLEFGERFYWRKLDIRDVSDCKQYVNGVVERWGRIDVLINNAGVLAEGVLPVMREDAITACLDINLGAVIRLTQLCSRAMLRRSSGTIVQVSSINGIRGAAGVAVYSATKAGLDGLTRSLAKELGPRGIRVNSVAPGYFESEMTVHMGAENRQRIVRRTPLGRLGGVKDLVGVVRFLISDEAAFITGQTIVVDGGLTC